MITDTAKAIKATKELVAAVPFLGGSSSESDYREALALVDYLIENDDENPLIDFLASKMRTATTASLSSIRLSLRCLLALHCYAR